MSKLTPNCRVVQNMGYSYDKKVVEVKRKSKQICVTSKYYSKTTTQHIKMLVSHFSSIYEGFSVQVVD